MIGSHSSFATKGVVSESIYKRRAWKSLTETYCMSEKNPEPCRRKIYILSATRCAGEISSDFDSEWQALRIHHREDESLPFPVLLFEVWLLTGIHGALVSEQALHSCGT